MIGLGAFVPYLAEENNLIETDYSILFLARASGYIVGALSVKLIEKYYNYHQCLGISYILSVMFAIIFSFISGLYLSAFYICLASIGYSWAGIFTNISTIHAFRGKNLDNWLQFLHGCFGVGGLVGPYLVLIFEFHTYTILGIFVLGPIIVNI